MSALAFELLTWFIIEYLKLHRANQQLQHFLEAGPRRALKLANQCLIKRRQRPVMAHDVAQGLLESEKQDAKQLTASLEHCHAATITLLKRLTQTRQATAKLIAQEKRATSLHSEAHSGVVKGYQRPQGRPPPPVGVARELIQAARIAHANIYAQMQAARESLGLVHAQVTAALQQAITDGSKTKVYVASTR